MSKNSKAIYDVYMFLVVAIWSVSPLFTKAFFDYYSATAYNLMCSIVNAVCFTLLSVKKFNLLNKQYFKVAVVTGACYALACISQKSVCNTQHPLCMRFWKTLPALLCRF